MPAPSGFGGEGRTLAFLGSERVAVWTMPAARALGGMKGVSFTRDRKSLRQRNPSCVAQSQPRAAPRVEGRRGTRRGRGRAMGLRAWLGLGQRLFSVVWSLLVGVGQRSRQRQRADEGPAASRPGWRRDSGVRGFCESRSRGSGGSSYDPTRPGADSLQEGQGSFRHGRTLRAGGRSPSPGPSWSTHRELMHENACMAEGPT